MPETDSRVATRCGLSGFDSAYADAYLTVVMANIATRWFGNLREALAPIGSAIARRAWAPIGLVALIGAIDFITGPEMLLGILYLLPISIVAWWHNARRVSVVAIVAALTWLIVDLVGGRAYTSPLIPYWNALTRLAIFWGVGLMTHHARTLQSRQLDLINYVVHDMRSPLTVFANGLEFVAADIANNRQRQAIESIEPCRIAAASLETLIDSILDLARLEEGKMPISIEALPVKDVVRAALREASVLATANHVSLREEIETGADAVLADRLLLHRILINLLTNAIKASPENSPVRLRVEPKRHGEVVFAVVDAGPGFRPEYISEVFEKYMQIRPRGSGGAKGSGLGLAFCRLAVLSQQGRIWVENIPNGGAAVFIALPSTRANP